MRLVCSCCILDKLNSAIDLLKRDIISKGLISADLFKKFLDVSGDFKLCWGVRGDLISKLFLYFCAKRRDFEPGTPSRSEWISQNVENATSGFSKLWVISFIAASGSSDCFLLFDI